MASDLGPAVFGTTGIHPTRVPAECSHPDVHRHTRNRNGVTQCVLSEDGQSCGAGAKRMAHGKGSRQKPRSLGKPEDTQTDVRLSGMESGSVGCTGMSASATATYAWNQLPWRKLEVAVFKLERRIDKASHARDIRRGHRLQKLLLKSRAAKLLAVRRVTQDNQSKNTAGIDGVKSLTPRQRYALADHLGKLPIGRPPRRVWIPKPGTDERRPLSIPTLHDRALHALVKLALEPEWEARFEPNSDGFRPGRSVHDAIGAIFIAIEKQPKYALDADIAKCFDAPGLSWRIKQPLISASTTSPYRPYCKSKVRSRTASPAPRPGRSPSRHPSNSCSSIAFRILAQAACSSLSSITGMPKYSHERYDE